MLFMRCARERRQTGVAAEVPGPGEEGERTGGCEHPEDGGGGGEGRSEEGAERRQEQGEQELPEPADPAVRAEEDHPDLFGEQVAPSRCVHGRAPTVRARGCGGESCALGLAARRCVHSTPSGGAAAC